MFQANYYIKKLFDFDGFEFWLVDYKKLQKKDPNWSKIRGCWDKDYMPDNEIWISDRVYKRYKHRILVSKESYINVLLILCYHEYIETKIILEMRANLNGKINNKIISKIAHNIAKKTENRLTFKKRFYRKFRKKIIK
ncbi:MAG: hypothetical protein GF317_05810 [Candidatus Lokiarchaeota archaeon]|nr:hypothetical protein [Candidatus Lokiarchaeota archaeon]